MNANKPVISNENATRKDGLKVTNKCCVMAF